MADRIGVIRGGELILVEDKAALMAKLGRKRLVLDLAAPLDRVPDALAAPSARRCRRTAWQLTYAYEPSERPATPIRALCSTTRGGRGSRSRDVTTSQNTLEDIFVDLVSTRA